MVTSFGVSLDSATPAGGARPASGLEPRPSGRRAWQAAYIRRLWVSDTLIVIAAVALAQWVRFGDRGVLATSAFPQTLSYTLVSALLVASWLATLIIFRTRASA